MKFAFELETLPIDDTCISAVVSYNDILFEGNEDRNTTLNARNTWTFYVGIRQNGGWGRRTPIAREYILGLVILVLYYLVDDLGFVPDKQL